MDALRRARPPYLADPILDPIHFGFTASLGRYAELRRRGREAEILMGTGNLTELTDADTTGITADAHGHRLGTCTSAMCWSCRSARIAGAPWRRPTRPAASCSPPARTGSLPNGYRPGAAAACTTASPSRHARRDRGAGGGDAATTISASTSPRTASTSTTATATMSATDPFDLFPQLGVESDGSHAFYLGAELAKAEIAWQLGKRYVQDQPLRLGLRRRSAGRRSARAARPPAPRCAAKRKARSKR